MRFQNPFRANAILMIVFVLLSPAAEQALAQRGRGGAGARPSMGRVGGSGLRPSMPAARPNMTRPGTMGPSTRPALPGNSTRPTLQKPTFGNASQRPSLQRPSTGLPGQPSLGGSRPSLGGAGTKPKPTIPSTRPGGLTGTTRPALPGNTKPSIRPPVTKPSLTRPTPGQPSVTRPVPLPGTPTRPNINRPSLGNTRPSPWPGGINRPETLPGLANRPTTLPSRPDRPGTLPGIANRPTTLPSFPNRPTTLPNIGNRPGFGSNTRPLPGFNTKPALPNRPGLGNGSINRPVIGGLRPSIGNNTDINIGQLGNNVTINRPNWDIVDPGFSRPNWGLNDDWHHHWYDNGINHHHHGWYNGCWHGHWDSNWYAPLAWGAVYWGLDTITSSWASPPVYYNPYYAEPVIAQSVPYDYSQPVIINNTVNSTGGDGGDAAAEANSTSQQGLEAFDAGLAAFRTGAYDDALSRLDSALKLIPNDPVVHEVRSLALFATGDYKKAAAGLNSLLASAPGMDWTTMSGLYGNPDDYTTQLRKLEAFCQANPEDASSHFVLAYHYLVMDAKDEAIDALQVVVKNQPKDVTARRMLEAMTPEEKPPTPPETETPPAAPAATPAEERTATTTDLVGAWSAKSGNSQVELTITEDSLFTWKVTTDGRPPVQLSGNLSGNADAIELVTADQGTMGGTVESKGPDAWIFLLTGAPKSDPGLSFSRVK
ncbi:MAG: tetratricopeptide repeat protein [Planctomycetota bacterium]